MDDASKQSRSKRFVDSFRRDPTASVTRHLSDTPDNKSYDIEAANAATAASPLLRRLKGRHLQMIAIGGSIGTGLFVGSGRALAYGGPASLLLAFLLIGLMIYCTVQALGEMAVIFPVAGSFSAFSTRFIDPSWGFAMGWNYCLQWLVVLPLEIVSASITVHYWEGNTKLNALWVSLFLLLIGSINLFGVKGYGEAEFVFSLIKVVSVIGYSKQDQAQYCDVLLINRSCPGRYYKHWRRRKRQLHWIQILERSRCISQWIQRIMLDLCDSRFRIWRYRIGWIGSSRNRKS